jgi:DNA modification methylase
MIQNKDVIEFLKDQDDKSVDLVFTDPPYNVKKDYGVYKDNRSPEEYVSWMMEVIGECRRISKRGIIFYVSSKLTKLYFDLIPDAHLIPVHKRAAGVFSGNYMLQYHSMFSAAKPVIKVKDLWDDVRLPGEGYYFREPRYDHPGLTSVALTEKVITYWTLPGEVVLDPFAGVGTTWVACHKLGRNFLGSEINPKYIDIAHNRIDKLLLDEIVIGT